MRELNSFDINQLAQQCDFLKGGKIDNIYQTEQKDLFLQIYIKDKPKQLLRIVSGKCFYLVSKRPSFDENMQRFCAFLRKHILNSRIMKFEQVGYERIIKICLEAKEGNYDLFAEFFGKGNIILTKQNKIIAVAEEQIWADRILKPGEIYKYPEIKNSKDFFEKQKEKASFITMEEIEKEFGVSKKESPKDKEINKITNIIEKQKEQMEKAKNESEESKRKGELIYENYKELEELFKKIKASNGKITEELKKDLRNHRIFKDIEEKEKILAVDL